MDYSAINHHTLEGKGHGSSVINHDLTDKVKNHKQNDFRPLKLQFCVLKRGFF